MEKTTLTTITVRKIPRNRRTPIKMDNSNNQRKITHFTRPSLLCKQPNTKKKRKQKLITISWSGPHLEVLPPKCPPHLHDPYESNQKVFSTVSLNNLKDKQLCKLLISLSIHLNTCRYGKFYSCTLLCSKRPHRPGKWARRVGTGNFIHAHYFA